MKSIKNKVVLITGASSGIGEATAKLLSKQGAHVLLLARNEQNLLRVQAEIHLHNGVASCFPIDLSNISDVRTITSRIKQEIGIPDIIINNAGAGNWFSIFETSNDEFVKMQAVPHLAAFFITKAFIHEMVKRGSGHVISINSASCFFSYPGAIGYLSSRWALRSFSEALHSEMHGTGVNVSMVVAGKVDSPYFSNNPVSEERIPKIATALSPVISVNVVATAIAKTIHSKNKTVIVPFSMNVLIKTSRFFPQLFSLLLRKTGHHPSNVTP